MQVHFMGGPVSLRYWHLDFTWKTCLVAWRKILERMNEVSRFQYDNALAVQ